MRFAQFLLLIMVLNPSLYSAECPGVDRDTAESLEQRIQAQFAPLVTDSAPGYAVGVIEADGRLHEAYFGRADLEHEVDVHAGSRFYIGSVSKQFTAAIAAQLMLEGRLHSDDRVDKWLDDWPQVYATITIGDLIHHTSGLREYTSLMLMRGDDRSLQDRMRQVDAMRLIVQQRGLNFEPGTQYRYSSSGYVVLAAVIEKIEGRSLRQVARDRLFEPLEMNDTQFDDRHWEVVKNRVQSYRGSSQDGERVWRTWLKHFEVVGDGGVLTTIRDLARWDRELSTSEHFGSEWRSLMHRTGSLRDGTKLDYAFGLQRGILNGEIIWRHGGGMGGFISDQIRIESLGKSIYVLANRNDRDAFQAWPLAESIIKQARPDRRCDSEGEPHSESRDLESLALDADAVESVRPWLGAYFSDQLNNRRFLAVNAAGELELRDGSERMLARLKPIGDQHFQTLPRDGTLELRGTPASPELRLHAGSYRYSARRFDARAPQAIDEVSHLTGRYYSDELDAHFELAEHHGRLMFQHGHLPPREVFPEMRLANGEWNSPNLLWTGTMMIKFRRDESGRVVAADVGDARVISVRFQRTAP